VIAQTMTGLGWFLAYFATATALCVAYVFIYTRLTAHDEIALIVKGGNASAAVSLGMSLLGFSFPLASAIRNSANLLDCVLWGVIALAVQIAAYYVARLLHPTLSEAIEKNTMAAALWLGFVSLTAGVLNAVSMST
jgi:putative membrane protein